MSNPITKRREEIASELENSDLEFMVFSHVWENGIPEQMLVIEEGNIDDALAFIEKNEDIKISVPEYDDCMFLEDSLKGTGRTMALGEMTVMAEIKSLPAELEKRCRAVFEAKAQIGEEYENDLWNVDTRGDYYSSPVEDEYTNEENPPWEYDERFDNDNGFVGEIFRVDDCAYEAVCSDKDKAFIALLNGITESDLYEFYWENELFDSIWNNVKDILPTNDNIDKFDAQKTAIDCAIAMTDEDCREELIECLGGDEPESLSDDELKLVEYAKTTTLESVMKTDAEKAPEKPISENNGKMSVDEISEALKHTSLRDVIAANGKRFSSPDDSRTRDD